MKQMLKEIIEDFREVSLEEWRQLTWFGRFTWFPILIIISILLGALFAIAIPISRLIERMVGSCLKLIWKYAKCLFYREE